MKAAVVNKIFSELSEECNKYPDGVHMNIDKNAIDRIEVK